MLTVYYATNNCLIGINTTLEFRSGPLVINSSETPEDVSYEIGDFIVSTTDPNNPIELSEGEFINLNKETGELTFGGFTSVKFLIVFVPYTFTSPVQPTQYASYSIITKGSITYTDTVFEPEPNINNNNQNNFIKDSQVVKYSNSNFRVIPKPDNPSFSYFDVVSTSFNNDSRYESENSTKGHNISLSVYQDPQGTLKYIDYKAYTSNTVAEDVVITFYFGKKYYAMNIRVIQSPIFSQEVPDNDNWTSQIVTHIPEQVNGQKSSILYTSICYIYQNEVDEYITEYYNQNVEGSSFKFDFNTGLLTYTKNGRFQKFIVYYHYLSYYFTVYSAGQLEYEVPE